MISFTYLASRVLKAFCLVLQTHGAHPLPAVQGCKQGCEKAGSLLSLRGLCRIEGGGSGTSTWEEHGILSSLLERPFHVQLNV